MRRGVQNMDILKNTDAMGKRIFADLEKINFIPVSYTHLTLPTILLV